MHAAEAVSSPLSPTAMAVCDRSSYKRSLFSRIRDSQMHYLTGPETTVRPSHHRLGFIGGVEPLRDGQAHQLIVKIQKASIDVLST